MLEVNVEGGKVIDSQPMDLGNVVFVACQSAGRRSSGQCDLLDESKSINYSVRFQLSQERTDLRSFQTPLQPSRPLCQLP